MVYFPLPEGWLTQSDGVFNLPTEVLNKWRGIHLLQGVG